MSDLDHDPGEFVRRSCGEGNFYVEFGCGAYTSYVPQVPVQPCPCLTCSRPLAGSAT